MERWAKVDDVPGAGELRRLVAGPDLEVAVARLEDGSVVAFGDTCTHEECSLSDGDLEGERVVCVCHGSEFDVRTGQVLRGPAEEPIPVFETRGSGDGIEVLVTDGP